MSSAVLTKRSLLALAGSALLPMTSRAAQGVDIRDIAGRDVRLAGPARRMILGEGRQMYLVAALETADPFARVVGWRDDFRKADLDGYGAYLRRYPQIERLPTFGGAKEGTFDVEQAIGLKPDVVVMNLESKPATDGQGLIEKLGAVGIPVVFIDFRERPFEHAERSIAIMGQVMGLEARAAELIVFRRAEMEKVTGRLAGFAGHRPRVMVERAAGYDETCCMSFGDENFGRMVTVAGGENIASRLIPGTFGVINPEQVIAAEPEVVVVTGSNWVLYAPDGQWVGVGPGADPAQARAKLARLMERPAYRTQAAVRARRVHAIWHQFYDSPYQFVAVQALAKWLHPELFADLDPDATFRAFHERFLPVPYQPGYWASL
ncbi:ABC transporter substrate-binding protein [Roseomonas gilardii]|uniref:ABC transporter substrate-binding protein n=1 Tax=Roseomonas gilardii TaxID=257708 RepID=A0A1L7AB25_9PROT|nr:ABC transporter substrate-binding protein [Roseomonas gilardii]APT56004.1 ABC transporter substrate-binding protein [Roseomonas gilardii]